MTYADRFAPLDMRALGVDDLTLVQRIRDTLYEQDPNRMRLYLGVTPQQFDVLDRVLLANACYPLDKPMAGEGRRLLGYSVVVLP